MTRLRKLLTNRLYLSAVGVVLVLVVSVAYLFGAVLDRPITRTPDEITVQLRSTGGLFEGSAVTYRGVKVGKVVDLTLTDTGVEARVVLTSADRIPADSLAQVRSLSPVGEQYLDFQPRTDGGPYLEDGGVVTASSTDVPRSLASTVVAVNEVLRQIDDRKLRRVLVELSTGLRGTGDDVGRLVDEGALLLEELDDVWPATDRLLRDADVALDVGIDHRADLEDLGRTASSLAAFLRDYDPELRRTLARTPRQLRQLQRLVADARRVLPDFLSVGVSFTDILATHDPHVAALLQSYGPGLGVLADKIEDGHLRIQLITDDDPRCDYGGGRRGPREAARRPLPQDLSCPASFRALQRGAAHAPGPVRR